MTTLDQPLAAESSSEIDGCRPVTFYAGDTAPTNEWLGVQRIPISLAREFHFESPVVAKTVYLSHPLDRRHLIPFADYEGVLCRDKLNEALRLVTELGASKVVARAMKGYIKQNKFYAGVAPFSIDVSGEHTVVWEVAYECEGAGRQPTDACTLAYPEEPGFEAARIAVLENGARRVRLEIQSQTTFAMGGELAGRLRDCGLKLGAGTESYRCNYFLLEAEFPEKTAGTTMAA